MCRSSRVPIFVKISAIALGVALEPTTGLAQVYGFPSEVGVIDDGFGTLPREPTSLQPEPVEVPIAYPGLAPGMAARRTAMVPCPLVIQIGRGLRHPARTRVTYGRPGCF